jgi:hypothetical protein
MKDSASVVEQRAFLLAASAWQESLLQSYRSLHVTIQGFLIAASSAVLAVQLTGAVQEQSARPLSAAVFNLAFTALLGLLFWLQGKTAAELQGVVESRAADINHWHKVTMLSENELEPSQRAFTYFKMWQHAHRADVAHVLPRYLAEEGVSEAAVEELIGKGLGHTRRVLDINLFSRLHTLCLSILFTSAAITVWFAIGWWRSLPVQP